MNSDYYLRKEDFSQKKWAFCQVATPEVMDYAEYTLFANERYCEKHGYDFRVTRTALSSRWPTWEKVLMTLQYMVEYDFVYMLDADAMIINHETELRELLVKDKDFYLCNDERHRGRPYSINTGTWLLRVDEPWKKDFFSKFFHKWWELGESLERLGQHDYWHEQTVLNVMLFELNYMNVMHQVRVVPYEDLDDLLLHVMQQDTPSRIARFSYHLEELELMEDFIEWRKQRN